MCQFCCLQAHRDAAQVFSSFIMQNNTTLAAPVLQHPTQEDLCYGNGLGPENNGMTSSSNPASTETLLLGTQPRQEPQGQEHQVDSSSMEKITKEEATSTGSLQIPHAIPGHGVLELPPYETVKSQSQLYKAQQGPNELQNATRALTGGQNSSDALQDPNPGMGHTFPSLQNAGMGHTQANLQTHTDQNPSYPNPNQNRPPQVNLKTNQQQGVLVSSSTLTSTSSCPSSFSSAPSLTRSEGCSWVQQGFTGVDDEGLSELKQGHVRSLSEHIMQLSLERNGAKQPRETSPNGAEHMASTSAPSKPTPPPAPPFEPSNKESRGPPPEYPFKDKILTSYPSSPSPISIEQTPLSIEASPGQFSVSGPMPPQVPGLRQAGSGARLPPQGQIVPAEAFSMMSRAQHMVSYLSEENQRLRQELLMQAEKTGRLQRLEAEVQHLSDTYESLVKSSSKRETLDKTMKMKLEGEIRRLHDFNRDLRERLETANRQLANQNAEGQEDSHGYQSSGSLVGRESLKEIERLETEAESLRSANQDQRRHIEILEQALNNAQSKVVRLEEELGRKNVYVERVERLQQALAQLQAACEKREQLEKRLRTRLERELETLRSQQRAGVGVCESSAPALLDLLREREERILGLEADRMRWEQKYLEESAMRQFTMEAAATAAAQRDTTIIQHSRSGSYSDACLWQHDGDEKTHNRRCQDIEIRMKDLHAQLLEKIAMIKVLQQRSRRDSTPLRPARSVPSIAALHSRQASQTEGALMEKDSAERPPPSPPSYSAFLSSLPPSLHPPSVSTLPHPSVTSTSFSSSLLPSSSATLPLPSTHLHSLPPLPRTASSSLPSTPLLSLHSKSASRDSGTQTGRGPDARTTPPTGRGKTSKTESPPTQTRTPESRTLPAPGQRIRPPDSDLVEILI
ncbi:angiomotin-like protein 1 isoform X2 [Trichomycterus rosablanca]|uniref:angiomotin-like protein 1 isoform X2 n=1 Tax=Trichomycterus rosablanca TaxID=2290929 RepID=UPI002F360AF8